jgi:ketosteroid isomerase-like protein
VEADRFMTDRRKVGMRALVIVLILFTMMAVSGWNGCDRRDNDPPAPISNPNTPSKTLSELQKAIREEDILAMATCYTDPFDVTSRGETKTVSHGVAGIACAFAFGRLDYSTWSLEDRSISITGTQALASCTQRMYVDEQVGWVSGAVVYRMRRVGSTWYIYEEIMLDPEYDLSPVGRIKTAGA